MGPGLHVNLQLTGRLRMLDLLFWTMPTAD
jgi:hypothetical protein